MSVKKKQKGLILFGQLLLIIRQLLFILIAKKAKNTAIVLQFNATLLDELDFVTLIT